MLIYRIYKYIQTVSSENSGLTTLWNLGPPYPTGLLTLMGLKFRQERTEEQGEVTEVNCYLDSRFSNEDFWRLFVLWSRWNDGEPPRFVPAPGPFIQDRQHKIQFFPSKVESQNQFIANSMPDGKSKKISHKSSCKVLVVNTSHGGIRWELSKLGCNLISNFRQTLKMFCPGCII